MPGKPIELVTVADVAAPTRSDVSVGNARLMLRHGAFDRGLKINMTRPRAADDFATIHKRMEELRHERDALTTQNNPPTRSAEDRARYKRTLRRIKLLYKADRLRR
jgi:hypothetical protein